jgi:hypothetical protein
MAFGHLLGQLELFKVLASSTSGSFHSIASKVNPNSTSKVHIELIKQLVEDIMQLEKAWRMSAEQEADPHDQHHHLESQSEHDHQHHKEEDSSMTAILRGPWQASYLKLFERTRELCATSHLPSPTLPPGFEVHTTLN